MTTAYMFLRCDEFPELELGESTGTSVEMAFAWGDESVATCLTFQGQADDPDFERYSMLYQVENDVDVVVQQKEVNRLIENRRFHVYCNRSKNYLLIQTNQRDARNAIKRLRNADPAVIAHPEEINLLDVLPIGDPTGAVFGKLRIAKIRSAALHGTVTVVDSEEWQHLAEAGEARIVYMRAQTPSGDERPLQLMVDRSVVLMKDVSERQNLEFVADLQGAIDQVLAAQEA